MEEYRRCVRKSDGDEAELRVCEALLKALDV